MRGEHGGLRHARLRARRGPGSLAASDELTRVYLAAFSDVMAAVSDRLELDVCLRRRPRARDEAIEW